MVIKFYSQNNLKGSVLLGLQRDRLLQGKGGMGAARESMEEGTGLVGHISIPIQEAQRDEEREPGYKPSKPAPSVTFLQQVHSEKLQNLSKQCY